MCEIWYNSQDVIVANGVLLSAERSISLWIFSGRDNSKIESIHNLKIIIERICYLNSATRAISVFGEIRIVYINQRLFAHYIFSY